MANVPVDLEHHRWRPVPAQAEAAAGPGREYPQENCTVRNRDLGGSIPGPDPEGAYLPA